MAIMLKAGIPAIQALEIVEEDAQEGSGKELIHGMVQSMAMSGSLSEAMKESGVFPVYMSAMTRIGEESGRLDEVMDSLTTHYKREENMRLAARNAIIYPAVMTVMILAVLVVLLVYVMPVFRQVFAELGVAMTGFPLVLYKIGMAIKNYALVFAIILALVVAFVCYLTFSESGKALGHRLGSSFRSVRAGREEKACFRFASAMSTMMRSGLHMDEALALAEELNEDEEFGTKIHALRERMDQGENMADVLKETGLFSGVQAQMAMTGYRAGSLDDAMEQIAMMNQDAMDKRFNNRLALFEPVMVVVLCVLVGAILLSVMFPLLGMMSGM